MACALVREHRRRGDSRFMAFLCVTSALQPRRFMIAPSAAGCKRVFRARRAHGVIGCTSEGGVALDATLRIEIAHRFNRAITRDEHQSCRGNLSVLIATLANEAAVPAARGISQRALSQFEAFSDQWCLIRPRCSDDDSQRLATPLATGFDSLGCCDPGTCRNARSRLDHAERPVRDAAVDRASRVALCVRPWPRLGHARISGRGKVAPIRIAQHDGGWLLAQIRRLGRDWWPRSGPFSN